MSRLPVGIHNPVLPTLPVHVMEAPVEGPTVIIQGGIHGDEIAGVHAIQELLEADLRPARGRLVVIPVMNPAAYRARNRCAPGGLDLNRCFPGDPESPELERRLAAFFMALVQAEQPALVATLHESKTRYHPEVHPSFGQTLVYGVTPVPHPLTRAVERLNQTIQGEDERWATHYYPVSTSSTEVIVDAVGCVGTCVETWMGFPLQRRVEMQREVVLTLLSEFEVI